MSNIKSFIDELKQLNENDCFNVLVPSLGKKVKFRAFSVKQHKDLVKSLLDGVEGTVNMYKVFNDIVFENSLEEVDFTLYDRNKILVDLRKQCVSETIKVDDKEYNLDSLPEFIFDFEKEREFTYRGIVASISIPTLSEDSKITEKSIVEFSKYSSEDKKIGNSLSILLVYELMKFIKIIKIDDNVINFSDLGTFDKKTIIENLPLKLNNDILEYIAQFKEYEQSLFTFSDGTKLVIDVSFLSNE
jgi:hypothetical protein